MRQSIPPRPSTRRRGATAGYPGSAATLKPRSASRRRKGSAISFGTKSVGRTPSTERSCARLASDGMNGSEPQISERRGHDYAVSSMTGSAAAARIAAMPTSARSIQTTLIQVRRGATSLAWCSCAYPKLASLRSSKNALPGVPDATDEAHGTSGPRVGVRRSDCPRPGVAGLSFRTSTISSSWRWGVLTVDGEGGPAEWTGITSGARSATGSPL